MQSTQAHTFYTFAEVTIGLEKTAFTVPEDVGTVEVCVSLNCPGTGLNCLVAYIFDAHLSTMDGTAGTHIIK